MSFRKMNADALQMVCSEQFQKVSERKSYTVNEEGGFPLFDW
jgi:hypothetical protein